MLRGPLFILLFLLGSLVLLPSSVYAQITNGLVGEYLFNGNLNDGSSFNVTGIGHNITPVQGYDGNPIGAYYFNGIDSWIDVGTNPRNVTTETTVVAYFKTTMTGVGIIYRSYYYPPDGISGVSLTIDNLAGSAAGQMRIIGRDSTIGSRTSGYSPLAYNDGQWHCTAGVVSANGDWSIYVDGVLVSTQSSPNTYNLSNHLTQCIGKIGQTDNAYFEGAIDDVRIYNRALTQAEIMSLCTCGPSLDIPQSVLSECASAGSITVSANTNADSLFWSNSPINDTFTEVLYPDSGWVRVEAYDSTGCPGLDSVLIIWFDNEIDLGPEHQYQCRDSTHTIIASNVDSAYWPQLNLSSHTLSIQYPDSGMFYAEGYDNGCLSLDTVYIHWYPQPTVDVPDNPMYGCKADNSLIISAIAQADSLYWTATGTNDTFIELQYPQDGWIYVEAYNNLGCQSTDSVEVIWRDEEVDLGQSHIYECPATGTVTITASSNVDSVYWPQFAASNYSVAIPFPDSGMFYVEGYDNGCLSLDTVYVHWYPGPIVNIPDNSVTGCKSDGSLIISAVAQADSVFWPLTSSNDTFIEVNYPYTGWIRVDAFTVNGCRSSDSVQVLWNEEEINLGPEYVYECKIIGTVTVTASSNMDSVYWPQLGGSTTSIVVQFPDSGMYYAEGYNNGCLSLDTVYVHWYPDPSIDLGPDQSICDGESLLLETIPSQTGVISWSTGETAASIVVQDTGTYWVRLSSTCGNAWDTIHISERADCPFDTVCGSTDSIFMANTFTPNGDGRNDKFVAFSACPIDGFRMTIIDRWGDVVYDGTDILEGWNGTYFNQGKHVPMGTFIVRIRGSFRYGERNFVKYAYLHVVY